MFAKAPSSNPAVVFLLENGFLYCNGFEVTVKHLERYEVGTVWHGFTDECDAVLATVTTKLHFSVTRVGELDPEMGITEALPCYLLGCSQLSQPVLIDALQAGFVLALVS